MNKFTWLLSLLLFGAVILSVIFINRDIISQQPHQHSNIDSFMINAKYQQYNTLGQIHFTLTSSHMRHFQLHDIAYFTKPHLFGYTAERIPWQVDAEQGKTIKGTHQINFWDNAILKQLSYPKHPDITTIKTTAITIYPYQSLGITDKPVTIIRPNSVANGIGMRADFKTGILELLSQTQGTYAPKKNS